MANTTAMMPVFIADLLWLRSCVRAKHHVRAAQSAFYIATGFYLGLSPAIFQKANANKEHPGREHEKTPANIKAPK